MDDHGYLLLILPTLPVYLHLENNCTPVDAFPTGQNNKPISDAQKEETKLAMINLMNSYVDAIKEGNADKIIAHYLDSPEFMLFENGIRQGYSEFVGQVLKDFSNISKYEGKWDTILVSVLNPDAVAAAAPFHEVLTDKEGVETPLKGEVTNHFSDLTNCRGFKVQNGDKNKN